MVITILHGAVTVQCTHINKGECNNSSSIIAWWLDLCQPDFSALIPPTTSPDHCRVSVTHVCVCTQMGNLTWDSTSDSPNPTDSGRRSGSGSQSGITLLWVWVRQHSIITTLHLTSRHGVDEHPAKDGITERWIITLRTYTQCGDCRPLSLVGIRFRKDPSFKNKFWADALKILCRSKQGALGSWKELYALWPQVMSKLVD